jgi:hypothetical protein
MIENPPAVYEDGAGDWTPAGLVTPYTPGEWEQIKADSGPAPVMRHSRTWMGVRDEYFSDSAHDKDDFSSYRFPRLQRFMTRWFY